MKGQDMTICSSCPTHRSGAFCATVIAAFVCAFDASAAAIEREPFESGMRDQSDRIARAHEILNRWEPIAVRAGAHFAAWRDVFATQLTAMDASVLQSLDRVEASADDAKRAYARFANAMRAAEMQSFQLATSGKGHVKLASTTTDQVFVPIVPCRIVDTRIVGGPIAAGTTRNFLFYATNTADDWSAQGGVAGTVGTTCPGTILPNGGTYAPSAAVVTITVVSPSAAGNWIVWGGADPVPTVSALNWTGPGEILANTTVIPEGGRSGTGSGGPIGDFAVRYNGPSGSAQFVADVVGYLVENKATALDCQATPPVIDDVRNCINGCPDPQQRAVTSDACPSGWTLTSGDCAGSYTASTPNAHVVQTAMYYVGAFPNAKWHCEQAAIGGNNINNLQSSASAICCRVPGR
jgi:hypothetical protein